MLVWTLLPLRTAGQGLEYRVNGRVTDSASGKALESVSVSIPGTHYATVTNADGEYVIKSSRPITDIRFSFLGYKPERRKNKGTDAEINVRMSPASIPIEEALLIAGNPWEILQEAIYRIQDNFPANPELMECFYRETIKKRSRYVYISEAVSKVYKTAYGRGVAGDRAALEKSRILLSQRRADTLAVKVMGGPAQAIYLDAVKNMDVIFDREVLQGHVITSGMTEYIDGRPQFVLNLAPGGAISENAQYYGTIYIDRETLSFTRIELSLDVSQKMMATRAMLVKKPAGLRFTPKELSLTLAYSNSSGVSRLSYCRTVMRFNCDWKKRLFSTPYASVNELVVTNLRDDAEPIPRAELFTRNDFLSDKSAFFSDPDFWTSYNIIEPTESLEHAIGKLKKQ